MTQVKPALVLLLLALPGDDGRQETVDGGGSNSVIQEDGIQASTTEAVDVDAAAAVEVVGRRPQQRR